MTTYVVVVAAAVLAVITWAFVRGETLRTLAGGLVAVLGGVAAVATLFEDPLTGDQRPVLIMFGAILAVAGGAVVTGAVFAQIDGASRTTDEPDDDSGSMRAAGELLRGGAWIGALERFAVFLTLGARWPEGIAVVLAVKGLGRYAELRSHAGTGAAERFIIGSLVSLAWGALSAYLVFEPYVISR